MKRSVLVRFLGACALALCVGCDSVAPQVSRWTVMGTRAQLSVRGGDPARNDALRRTVQETYAHLDDLLSAWNPQSELSRLAAARCTNWVAAASPEVRPCYALALRLAEQSGNAFNPRVGRRLRALGVAAGTSYADFDLGAIAKGFAVDVAAGALVCGGPVPPLLLDLGGNLRVVGEGTWRTGIRNPFDKAGPFLGVIALTNGESVATSGNYERFITRPDGTRVSHILDGRTGEPTRGIAAVTVVTSAEAGGAMLADGLSTTLFVLGPREGAAFLARHYPRTAALWVPDTPETPRLVVTPAFAARLAHALGPVTVVP